MQALWLGLAAALGVVISLVVMLRSMLCTRAHEGFQRFINTTANRDFSVLLIALAIAQRVEWFLWIAAIGVHVFWLMALWVQRRDDTKVAA